MWPESIADGVHIPRHRVLWVPIDKPCGSGKLSNPQHRPSPRQNLREEVAGGSPTSHPPRPRVTGWRSRRANHTGDDGEDKSENEQYDREHRLAYGETAQNADQKCTSAKNGCRIREL